MKRFVSVLLVAMLVLASMSVTVFAAEAGDTVDIAVTVSGPVSSFKARVSSTDVLTIESVDAPGCTVNGNIVVWSNAENVDSYTFYVTVKIADNAPVGTHYIGASVEMASKVVPIEEDTEDGVADGVVRCNVSAAGSVTITCEHVWDEGVETKAPTCTEDGEKTYTCEKCGETKTEAIPATGHDYVGVVTTPATCTEDGEMTYTCSICGDTYTEVIPSEEGHAWDEGVVTTPATCTKDGEMTYTCSKCGDTKTEVIPATGHKWSEDLVNTDPDNHYHECSVCGEKCSEHFGEHDMAIVDRASATDKTDGWELWECSVCGHQVKKVIPANPNLDPDVPGTGDISTQANLGMALLLITMFGATALVTKRKFAK